MSNVIEFDGVEYDLETSEGIMEARVAGAIDVATGAAVMKRREDKIATAAAEKEASAAGPSYPMFRVTAKNLVWGGFGRKKGKTLSTSMSWEGWCMFAQAILDNRPCVAPFLPGGKFAEVPLSAAAKDAAAGLPAVRPPQA